MRWYAFLSPSIADGTIFSRMFRHWNAGRNNRIPTLPICDCDSSRPATTNSRGIPIYSFATLGFVVCVLYATVPRYCRHCASVPHRLRLGHPLSQLRALSSLTPDALRTCLLIDLSTSWPSMSLVPSPQTTPGRSSSPENRPPTARFRLCIIASLIQSLFTLLAEQSQESEEH